MQNEATRMFRVNAVAEMYDVSPNTIYRAIRAKQLEAFRIGTGKGAIRIPEHALRVFEQLCAIDADEDPEVLADVDQVGEVA